MTESVARSVPQSLDAMGIRASVLEDLALKTLFLQGSLTVNELAAKMRLSLSVTSELFYALRRGQCCEVKGMVEGVHQITASTQGKARALELLSQNQYTGPAPVSLKEYVSQVHAQSVRNFPVHQAQVEEAFKHLVLPSQILGQLGSAIVSGTSIVLYGPTGTGKTSIAEAIPSIYHDRVWIPYAVEVDAQIITVFDPIVHVPDENPMSGDEDGRWVLAHRPRVIVGGELTAEMLDLQFHPVSKFYVAPLQMKANNGALILDDFGRQRMRPEELLNRWTVPLDRRIDFLTLLGGGKLEIPFDLFVVFATNLDPATLADEAFLRRIQNKIKVENLDHEQFHHVFRRLCERFGLKYESELVDYLIDSLTTEWKQPLRPCYPLDLVNQVLWTAQYEGKLPQLDQQTLARACRNYFLTPSKD